MRIFLSIVASGVLKGFDPLLNLVLDGTTEYLRGLCNSCDIYIQLYLHFYTFNMVLQYSSLKKLDKKLEYPLMLENLC